MAFATAQRSSQLYQTGRWRYERAEHLRLEPHCRVCLKDGVITTATVVDHIEPHQGDELAFWQRDNWQSLCLAHSNAKTAREVAMRQGKQVHSRRPTERHPGLRA